MLYLWVASRTACPYFCRNLKQFFGMKGAVMCVTSASVYNAGEDLLLDASLQIPWCGGRGWWTWVKWPSTRTDCQNLRVLSGLSPLFWQKVGQQGLAMCYAGILRSADWEFVTGVSGQPIGFIFKGRAVQENCWAQVGMQLYRECPALLT